MAEKKKAKPKKRRRKNPTPEVLVAANPSRRRRRRRHKNPTHHRRRRRRNPDAGGKLMQLAQFPSGQSVMMAILADLAIGFAVRRAASAFNQQWGTGIFGQPATSPYAGQGWSAQMYAVASLAIMLGARMIKGWKGEGAAREFSTAGWTQLARRVMYTEVLARNQWAQNTFGQVAQVVDTSDGTRWIESPEGGWYAMQGRLVGTGGMGDRLVAEGPYGDRLVREGPYGRLSPARAIDRQFNTGNQATFPGRDMGAGPDEDGDAYRRAWSVNMIA